MISSNINKFITSSLSLATLTITGISTAYCYGWGQSLFYGYPWWHVQIGNASMARSLIYVFSASVVIFLCYALGYCMVNRVFRLRYFSHLGWLRVIVLVSAFTIPLFITFYLFLGAIPCYLVVIYALITLICIGLFQHRWDHTAFQLDFRKMLSKGYFGIFHLFILCYFSLLSLLIGYLRADLRQTYDYLFLENKKHYILSTNRDNGYILGEKTKDNKTFLMFNLDTQQYYRIYVEKIVD